MKLDCDDKEKLQLSDKSVEKLGSKFDFVRLGNFFPPLPQNNVDFFIS